MIEDRRSKRRWRGIVWMTCATAALFFFHSINLPWGVLRVVVGMAIIFAIFRGFILIIRNMEDRFNGEG